jgi:hypothetical protein
VAKEACIAVNPEFDTSQSASRREGVLRLEAARILPEVVNWSEGDFEFIGLADEGLSDAEIVRCAANLPTLANAARVLDIGISDSPELDHRAVITDTHAGTSHVWAVRDITTDQEQASIWFRYHMDRVAQACSAAFEAR